MGLIPAGAKRLTLIDEHTHEPVGQLDVPTDGWQHADLGHQTLTASTDSHRLSVVARLHGGFQMIASRSAGADSPQVNEGPLTLAQVTNLLTGDARRWTIDHQRETAVALSSVAIGALTNQRGQLDEQTANKIAARLERAAQLVREIGQVAARDDGADEPAPDPDRIAEQHAAIALEAAGAAA